MVEYHKEHWELLNRKRAKAIEVMERLAPWGPIVHGSVARGDVRPDSDVDVVVPYFVEPFKIELALPRVSHGYIIMATPTSTPKVYLALDENEEVMVSFPLGKLTTKEREFYTFGGELDLEGLRSGKRVPGVNKALKLIIPTEKGHEEEEVVGREEVVANLLGISVDTVKERVYVLTRRRRHGRTGTLFKLKFFGSVEEAIDEAVKKDKFLRKRLLEEGLV